MRTDKLYRFVKADDRTPKYSDVILILHGVEIRKGGYVNGSFCNYEASRGWYPLSIRTSDIEWMEEVEYPAASTNKHFDDLFAQLDAATEESATYRKALEKIKQITPPEKRAWIISDEALNKYPPKT